MATRKTARVVRVEALGVQTRLLELAPDERLDFVGGQYLIVDAGVRLPDGKVAKRAYSIMSSDERQDRVTIAVKRLAGPGSDFLHALAPGAEVPFSGPWGQYLADDPRPRRATWVLATDTGITAALGLVSGRGFAPQRATTRLCWLVESERYFLPDDFVRAALPGGGLGYRREILPPVGYAERILVATFMIDRLLAIESPERVFLSGDGTVLGPLRERLVAAGMRADDVRVECFFNNPAKRST